MTTILYLKDADTYQNRRKLSGVAAYAKSHQWNLQTVVFPPGEAEIRELVDLWHPAGVIVNMGTTPGETVSGDFWGVPTLYFHDPDQRQNCIACDSTTIARCAARELLTLNRDSYAYLPWEHAVTWSNVRRDTFVATLAAHGKSVAILDPADAASASGLVQQIARGLKALARPLGLFAANDRMAALAVSACRIAGLSVPDDVAIVGVDDDIETCETSSPTLSSVSFDYYEAGRLAAETLAEMIARPVRNRICVRYQPLGITRRESTRRLAQPDAAVSAALERIRREACQGLSAADVLADFPCSRRLAEMRFRRAVGQSVLKEIRAVRLAKAQELMREGEHKLDYVANLCGYRSLAAFSAFFRSETGYLPSQWGKRRC